MGAGRGGVRPAPSCPQAEARSLADSGAVARLLLRAEAVASSRIEGLEVGSRRLLKAQLAIGLGEARDVTATEVWGNVDAMRWATSRITEAGEVTVEHLLEIHRRLMAGTRLERVGGQVRTEQNWIGGSSHNPCSAERRRPDRPQRAGRQRGHRPPSAQRRAQADDDRQAQPRLRGDRPDGRVHRPRTPARQPPRRHPRSPPARTVPARRR